MLKNILSIFYKTCYNLYKFFRINTWRKNIPVLLLILSVICIELYVFFGGNTTDTVFHDRYSCYALIVFFGTLFFILPKNKKIFGTVFMILVVLSCIFVSHTAMLYGNLMGFNVENLLHLTNLRSMLEFLKFNPNYLWEFPLSILLLAVCVFVSAFSMIFACTPKPSKHIYNKLLVSVIAAAAIYFFFWNFSPLHDFIAIYKSLREVKKYLSLDKTKYIEYGVKVTDKTANDITASPGKNLVFIILESTELAYLDEKKFPGLLPNLQKRHKKFQSFENMSMASNASLTFGGMFSMMTGSCLTAEYLTQGTNSHTKTYVGNRLSSFPKILNKAGYWQCFLAGHSGNFAGTENFVKSQLYDETWFGVDRSKREPSWEFSLRDSKVFEKAWEFFQTAAARKKPFNITLLTVDAHGPHGFHDPSEVKYPFPDKLNDKLYNAMYASDHALGKFLDRIEKHPEGKNTCIVIVSDHLAHSYSVSTPILEKEPHRRLLFLIGNSVKSKYEQDIYSMTFDIAPTVLAAMGVKHDYIFPLGENLYSETDVKRLQSSEQQMHALQIYIKLKSAPPTHINNGIKIAYQPYPHIVVGELAIPLRYGSVCDRLRNEDWYILPIPQHQILNASELIYYSSEKEYAEKKNDFRDHVFVAGISADSAKRLKLPSKTGFVLGIVTKGKSLVKFAESAETLSFSSAEIKKIIK